MKNKQSKNIKLDTTKTTTKTNNPDKKSNSKIKGDVWNLTPLLEGKSYEEHIVSIKNKVKQFVAYKSKLNNFSVQDMKNILLLAESIHLEEGKISAYYSMKFYENTKDGEALAKMSAMKQVFSEMSNDTLFFSLWFMHLEDGKAQKLINAPELKPYQYHLINIRKYKQYTKSEEIEKILTLKDITGSNAYADIYGVLTNGYTYTWKGKEVSKEEVVSFVTSENPTDRELAYKTILAKYTKESTVIAEIYKNIVLDWCNDGMKIRGYKSSIAIRNLGYDVSDRSVEVLLNTVRKNVKLFNEYFKVKYALNKKKGSKYSYSRYHLYAPFPVKNLKKYPYEEGKAFVLETYKKFDERFYEKALKIFNEKHVHSHPTDNKRGGAFCYDVSNDTTPYILLNHTDRLKDVFTMIHELGHGIHDLYSAKQVNTVRHPSLTIAETASVFSEMIMADRLLNESKNDEEKTYVLTQLLDNQYATVIRQAYFIMFEIAAHDMILNGASKEELDNKYYALLKEQFGDMELPKEFRHEWNQIPHIHESPFYCYSYAWGNLLVLALYDKYRKEGKPFIEKYIALLSAGGSRSPLTLMKELGLDCESEEFWQSGFNIIKKELDELKKLAK